MKKSFGFNFKHFKGDLLGGITAGIVALPLALAFGIQSGLDASSGLYGAIFISFFAALFGGTNTQISGPTAPMTAVSMVVIAGILADQEGDLSTALPYILMVFMLAGLIQIAMGLLKVGQYIRYIPYPVVSGFMTGIGVIILITQILPMLGYYPKEDTQYVNEFLPLAEEVILEKILREEAAEKILVLENFEETIARASEINEETMLNEAKVLAAAEASGVNGALKLVPRAFKNLIYVDLILGLLTILIIYGFKRITKLIPSTLIALILVSIAANIFFPGYRTIGQIPSGIPLPHLEIFGEFKLGAIAPYLISALSLAALGAIDSLLTSVVADNMTKTKHEPNKELVGQGIGNSVAALFGGIPGAGATIRTVVNINSGGKTKLSGMIAAILLLVVLVSFGPTASMIPASVLAGILVTVGIGVIDYKGLRHIKELPRSEVVVMFLVLVLTVFIGLIEAVAIGLVLASLLFMKKISDVIDHRTKSAPLAAFSKELPWGDENILRPSIKEKIYIKHLDGPMFFGFASRFQEMVRAMPEISLIVIRMEKVPYVDQSGLHAMEDAIKDMQFQNIQVVFTGVHGQPLDMFERFNLIPGLVERDLCFENFADCADWIRAQFGHQVAD